MLRGGQRSDGRNRKRDRHHELKGTGRFLQPAVWPAKAEERKKAGPAVTVPAINAIWMLWIN